VQPAVEEKDVAARPKSLEPRNARVIAEDSYGIDEDEDEDPSQEDEDAGPRST